MRASNPEKLRSTSYRIWQYCLVLCFVAQDVQAQSKYCSLVVRTASGSVVTLRSEQGKVLERRQAEDEKAEFCDLGLGRYEVEIGGGVCGSETFKHLRIVWPHTLIIKAGEVPPCEDVPQIFGGCVVTLRVRDASGPVSGANVALPDGGVAKTDIFGRYFLRLGKTSTTLTISAPGRKPNRMTLLCNGMYREQEVLLE